MVCDPCAEIPDLPETDEARRVRETKEELAEYTRRFLEACEAWERAKG